MPTWQIVLIHFFSRFERSDFVSDIPMLRESLTPQNDLVITQGKCDKSFQESKYA